MATKAPKRKRPPHVQQAYDEGNLHLLSAFGRKGGPIGGRIRAKQQMEDAAWRQMSREQTAEAIATDMNAQTEAEAKATLHILGLDIQLEGAYPRHRIDPDYELIPFAT